MPGKQLNPQDPAPQQQYKPHQHRTDEEEDGRVYTGLIEASGMIKASRKSSLFQYNTRVESSVNSNNKFQVFPSTYPSI